MSNQESRVREILTELRELWAKRAELDAREKALEDELALRATPTITVKKSRNGEAWTPEETAVSRRGVGSPKNEWPLTDASTTIDAKAKRRDALKKAAEKRGLVRVQGSAKAVEVPRWLQTKVLDKINSQPERRFKASDIAEELDAIVHLSVVNACLRELANGGFIRRVARHGPYRAQLDTEPQMGAESEDALDHAGPLSEDMAAPASSDLDDLPDDEGAAA